MKHRLDHGGSASSFPSFQTTELFRVDGDLQRECVTGHVVNGPCAILLVRMAPGESGAGQLMCASHLRVLTTKLREDGIRVERIRARSLLDRRSR
jgi:hypothetical protein